MVPKNQEMRTEGENFVHLWEREGKGILSDCIVFELEKENWNHCIFLE